MADLIGQRLGQYEIVALLGKGGMATVYRARQLNIEREVAVKVIKSDLVDNPDFVRRFKREAETLASLNHRHILKLFDYGQEGNIAYLVMELLTGGSLADLIEQGKVAPPAASRLLDQIASALDYAHRRGLIHRDMKPHNVLLDEDGNAVLTDFGIVKLLGNATVLTQSGSAIGTPAYMAPEQWRGQAVDARTDIYSLGIILYEMLAGRLPFVADTPFTMMHLHVNELPPPLRSLNPSLPSGVEPVIDKALAKDPDRRYESASALAQALKAALARPEQPRGAVTDESGPSALPTIVESLPTQRNRPILPVVGLVLAALLIVGGAIALLSTRSGVTSTDTSSTASPRAVGGNLTVTASPALVTPVRTGVTPTQAVSTAAPQPTTAAGLAMTQAMQTAVAVARFTKTPTSTSSFTPTPNATSIAATNVVETAVAVARFTKTPTPAPTVIPPAAMLYQTDFEDGQAKGWASDGGVWQVITEDNGNRVYQGTGGNDGGFSSVGPSSWKDYAIDLRFKRMKGDNLELFFRAQHFSSLCALTIYPPFGDDVGLRGRKTGQDWTVFNQQGLPLKANDWNAVHIEVKGDLIRVSINGRSLPDVHTTMCPNGYLGLYVGQNTTMVFDDIRVSSLSDAALVPSPTGTAIPPTAILYQTDFQDGQAKDWVSEFGFWRVTTEANGNRVYRGSGGSDGGFSHVGLPSWKDYAVEFHFKRVKNSHLEITVRTQDIAMQNFYGLVYFDSDVVNLSRKKGGNWTGLSDQPIATDDWNTVHIEVRGDLIRASINGRSLPDAHDGAFASGYLGLYVGPDVVILFDDIRVWSLS
jgi:serine/threonine protein kinase